MFFGVGAMALGFLAVLCVKPAVAGDTSRPIEVRNPVNLPATLPADRTLMTPVDSNYSYKPTMAMLPSGELVMMAFSWSGTYGVNYHEWATLWRSTDSGKNWSAGVRVKQTPGGQDLNGREHWLTSIDNGTPNGILFSTVHLLPRDTANPTQSVGIGYINRSTDGGRTWTQTRIGPDGFNSPQPYTVTNRNVVQLPPDEQFPNGRLVFGVGQAGLPGRENYLWTSIDHGVTWEQSAQLSLGTYTDYQGVKREFSNGSFMEETYLDRNNAGELVAYVRLNDISPLFPMDAHPPSGNDEIDRTLVSKSTDGGMTWGDFVDCGDYGKHYTRVTRLTDGRLLMTFTQRAITEPFGLRALLSYDDGETWDFDKDQIILDENTPSGWASGGGFGNTIQLPDGSFISAYSYPTNAAGYQYPRTEVVRWSLPPVPEPATVVLLGVGALCLGLFGLVEAVPGRCPGLGERGAFGPVIKRERKKS